jgi:HK97 family phage major capsid protein
MSELATAIDAVNTAFTQFKAANDDRLKQSDALTEDKVRKINADLDRLGDEVKELLKAQNRRALGTDGDEVQKHADLFLAHRKGIPLSQAHGDVEEYRAYKQALSSYFRKGGAISASVQNALSVGSDPDGGYWVTPDLSGRIATLVYESSPIRQIASVQDISTDALEGVNDLDEAGAGWVGETTDRTETTTPEVGKWRIPVHEQYAEPRATQKLLDDAAVNVEDWLGKKVSTKFARMEETAFVSGNGINKPRGFLTYSAGTPSKSGWGVIEQVNSGASGAFAATNPGDKLIDLVFSLKAAYRANAKWLMGRLALGAARKLKDGQGNYLWIPAFSDTVSGNLIGHPVMEAEDMPVFAANSLSIAFGDFREAYQIVDRIGIRVLRDPFTSKPYVKFYSTKRVGGDVVNFESLKIMKMAA